jgi:YVTN family beta-propeller protein
VKIEVQISKILAFLMIFMITVFEPIFMLSDNASASQNTPLPSDLDDQQLLHDRRLSEVVKQTSKLNQYSHIEVGNFPLAIAILEGLGTIYVYVANSGSNTVSVIDARNNTKIGDVPVGEKPADIRVSNSTGRLYVANSGSNTVSVIDARNNTKIGDVPVGEKPADIGVSESTGTVYVANYRSNGISVIDAVDNKVVVGISFQEDPADSGYVECDGLAFPSSEQQYYVPSGTKCIARPNPGFEFVSWEENLEDGSTQLIQISRPASGFESFLDLLRIRSDEPEATLNVTKFGTFIANFKELPAPIPSEYWIPLYGIIASTIVGWSIPGIISWTKSKMDARKLNYYHKQITSLYGDGKLDENDVPTLDRLRGRVLDAYSEGKLNEKHYESLRSEISTLYEEIFRKKIESLGKNNGVVTSNKSKEEQVAQLRNEVEYAYSKGKINEKHYDLLSKAISKLNSSKENNDSS